MQDIIEISVQDFNSIKTDLVKTRDLINSILELTNSSGLTETSKDKDPFKDELNSSFTSTYLTCDGWTSGNPGPGGCIVSDEKGNRLLEKNFKDNHSNNFYEILALGFAVKEAIARNIHLIYTDSMNAIYWLRNGRPKEIIADYDTIVKTIQGINSSIKEHSIIVNKWDTSKNGQIPSDPGRKKK